MLKQLEEIAGHNVSAEDIKEAIKIYNKNRQAKREFVKNAGKHPEMISAVQRSAVLKSSYFMEKPQHTRMLNELNEMLQESPIEEWQGTRVVTSGIICDNPSFLKILDDNQIAIAADDVAHDPEVFVKMRLMMKPHTFISFAVC